MPKHFKPATGTLLSILAVAGMVGMAQAQSGVMPRANVDWIDLFDGRALAGWRVTEFGGQGRVAVRDGSLFLGVGSPLTGVTIDDKRPLPVDEYEIRLQARRLEGNDFFCGLTFPVRDSHCTLILGGWGGGLVGLSCLDGKDAADNETTTYESFKKDQWYSVRVRVTRDTISAWLDDRQRIICKVRDREVSVRPEVLRSRPLGVASYQTKAEVRRIQIRRLVSNNASGSGLPAAVHADTDQTPPR